MTTPPQSSPQQERAFATGPDVGVMLPDFTLPDQHGEPRSVSAERGDGRLFLVFVRGTEW